MELGVLVFQTEVILSAAYGGESHRICFKLVQQMLKSTQKKLHNCSFSMRGVLFWEDSSMVKCRTFL
jgi:hypothetical protein